MSAPQETVLYFFYLKNLLIISALCDLGESELNFEEYLEEESESETQNLLPRLGEVEELDPENSQPLACGEFFIMQYLR